ncbi:DUF3549 family protein [Photobacterium damselae subsp. piscicida]|uniref:DUF3549 family protein n=1 Tax=Photobacterium damselae TaxID=38293 RepID=UPI0002EE3409|nr:DUF3549 family protein [Photobacterium damselae]OLQ82287.1 hypothetical protein BEI67_02845 [Photobacterium damselae subsp. piscicida]TFZ63103.1 DUF3549 family protein [Photobacterium damselae subsp. piscicida]TJZ92443.1 DUF3549 family protein [Photobacterium damselae subsp. piscicida]BBC39761.1 hypothetical protein PDPE_1-00601 [Photobacterium damselae subsp. piscicida]
MDQFHTLTQLLDNAQCQYAIYDLGRRVTQLDVDQFKAVEENRQPYPWPLQQHANLALSFWQPNRTPSEEEQKKLANNPYTFKPNDDKMAMFHGKLRSQLQLEPSQYYAGAQQYLTGELGWDNWQQLGLQGLADVCSRLSQENNATLVRKAINHLPMTPLYALLGCLEHIELPDNLTSRISERLATKMAQSAPDIFLISALIRALSGSNETVLQGEIAQLLAQPHLCHPEILIAIAGRCWQGLNQPNNAELFLLRLAQSQNQALFNQLFSDLVMLPMLRGIMLQLLHGQANPELIQAIAELQQHARGQ